MLQVIRIDDFLCSFYRCSKYDGFFPGNHGRKSTHAVTKPFRTGKGDLKTGLLHYREWINFYIRSKEGKIFFPSENILRFRDDDDRLMTGLQSC